MIAEMATKAGAKYPHLVAAQWALESGFGKHQSGKNNFLGIKGPGTKGKHKSGTELNLLQLYQSSKITLLRENASMNLLRDGIKITRGILVSTMRPAGKLRP